MKKLSIISSVFMLACLLCLPVLVQAQSTQEEIAETTTTTAREQAQERRKTKQARVTEIKEEVAARKLAVKASVCEKQEAKLNAMIPRVTRNAGVIKGVIDKHYQRVQDFYASGQLTTPDYDTLVTAIELAKANAEASIETIEEYEVTVDCTSEEAGEQLDGFRSAAQKAKDDLKTYRKEVVALISALKSANASQNQEEDEANEETDTEETESNE
jgi:hypothetical protein